ncbi:hypothetical protein IJG78_00075 [Candidatus Saccharibacteria bacterium]|nr:hypothetical protein [Candidatus Saccharibacteria bacterium]
MSIKPITSTKSKLTTYASIFALIAFLGFAAFTTASVTNIASIVESNILANKNGVPEGWDSLSGRDTVEASTTATVNDGYVEYVTSLKNSDQNDSLSLTHVSSFVSEEDSSGFVPLAEKTLEYTYDPANENSWTPVPISAPENSDDGFKLKNALYVGQGGSNTDTIYFRYNVSPADDGTIEDKVSFVTENATGDTSLTTTTNSLDYQKSQNPVSDNSETSTASNTEEVAENPDGQEIDTSSEETESTYTKPLGVSSKTPSTSVMNASTLGSISISPDAISKSIIVIVIALGIFAISLIVYLVVRSKTNKKPAKK